MTEVLRAFLRSLVADQRRRARRLFGVPRGHNGSVTFIQRFGSALNLTPHFHVLVLDGVYPGPAHDLGSFVPLSPPETEDVARVLAGAARRIIRIVERRGFDNDENSLVSDEPLMALLTAAPIRSRIATGPEAGDRWRGLGDLDWDWTGTERADDSYGFMDRDLCSGESARAEMFGLIPGECLASNETSAPNPSHEAS